MKLLATNKYRRYRLSDPGAKPTKSLKSKLLVDALLLVFLGSLFVLVMPYLPRLNFLLHHPHIDPTSYRQASDSTRLGKSVPNDPKLNGNRLVLAEIGVNAQIIEGANIWVIGKNQGVWHESKNIDPTKEGNIVLAGHRFLYTATDGGLFYNLPELKEGNQIYIRWSDKVYEYEVYRTRSVLPSQVDIRNSDPAVPKKLTMYTCTPLGSTAERFVVEAKQI